MDNTQTEPLANQSSQSQAPGQGNGYVIGLEDQKKMAKFVSDEFDRYEKALQQRFEDAAQIYADWKGEAPTRAYAWQNAVHVPITFEAEQTITPRLFAALFPNEAPIDLVTYGDATEEQGIRILNLIKHYFLISDVQGKSIPGLQQCTLLGTGYMYSPWLFRTKWQVNKQTGERYQALVDNRPDAEYVSFFDMFPHPSKLEIGDGLPLIRRRVCDAEYLKRLALTPQYNFINIEEALKSELPKSYTSPVDKNNSKSVRLKKREEYEMLEYWGPWDASFKKDDAVMTQLALPYWIVVINRKVVIRHMPNPYNHQHEPYVKFTLYPDINPSWFGVGTGQIGMATQARINKLVNQRLDNVDLVMNKQGFYNGSDPLVNVKKLQVSIPGQWHKVSDTVSSIRWMDIPDVTASAYQEENVAKQDYREATGATVPLMPADEGQHRTASGINLLQGAAGARFKPILSRLEHDLVAALATQYLSNAKQFMAFPEWVHALNEDGSKSPIEISPEDIQAQAKFIPTGVSELLNKEVQIGQLLRFKEVTMQDPTVNRTEINKRIGQLMGFDDLDKLLIPQQPITMGPGQMEPQQQQYINQRMAEGASPEQIQLELLGQPPAGPEQMQGAQ